MDVPSSTLDASEAGKAQVDGGADAVADASSPDGATASDAAEAGNDGSSPPDAAADAIADTVTVSIEDDSGNAVPFTRVSALQRGAAITVTYLLKDVPGMGMVPLAFVYGPSVVTNEFPYDGVTLGDPLCGDGGSPTASGVAAPLVRTPSGLVTDRVVGATAPGLAGKYTATFANLPLATTNCQ